jgi:hypothetical protein
VRRRFENLVVPARDLLTGEDAEGAFVETDDPHRHLLRPRLEHAGNGDRSVTVPM